jgi:formylglycine-generating enzyme required for sulfatase activity
VLRGGSWFDCPQDCRAGARTGDAPGSRDNYVGLRVCFFLDKLTP